MQTKTVQVALDDGAVITAHAYGGDGPTVVFLHDLDCSSAYWDPMRARLHELDPDVRVVTMDLRGHGASTMAEEPSRKRLLKDVKRLCKELGLADPMLCGHGWGADIALASDFAGAVMAINPRMGRSDSVITEDEISAPIGMRGADAQVLASCRRGLESAKPLRRSRRDAPLLLVYSAPADSAALEGTEVLEQAAEVLAIQEGSRHLPLEMPAGMAALLWSWIEEVA